MEFRVLGVLAIRVLKSVWVVYCTALRAGRRVENRLRNGIFIILNRAWGDIILLRVLGFFLGFCVNF